MSGEFLLIYICNFHVFNHFPLIYIYKLHWNLNHGMDSARRTLYPCWSDVQLCVCIVLLVTTSPEPGTTETEPVTTHSFATQHSGWNSTERQWAHWSHRGLRGEEAGQASNGSSRLGVDCVLYHRSSASVLTAGVQRSRLVLLEVGLWSSVTTLPDPVTT
jgi:hypothetical protein